MVVQYLPRPQCHRPVDHLTVEHRHPVADVFAPRQHPPCPVDLVGRRGEGPSRSQSARGGCRPCRRSRVAGRAPDCRFSRASSMPRAGSTRGDAAGAKRLALRKRAPGLILVAGRDRVLEVEEHGVGVRLQSGPVPRGRIRGNEERRPWRRPGGSKFGVISESRQTLEIVRQWTVAWVRSGPKAAKSGRRQRLVDHLTKLRAPQWLTQLTGTPGRRLLRSFPRPWFVRVQHHQGLGPGHPAAAPQLVDHPGEPGQVPDP